MGMVDHEGGAEFPYYKDDVFNAFIQAVPLISGMKLAISFFKTS